MPSRRITAFAPCSLVALAAGACTGVATSSPTGNQQGGERGDEVPGVGGDDVTAQLCEVPRDGWTPVPMRRLTAAEYDHAVADLLGETRPLASEALSADEAISGYAANIQVTVSVPEAEKLAGVARAVAEGAIGRLGEILRCASGQSESACGVAFVERFGRLAFRRTLTDEERGLLVQIYGDKAQATTHAQGVRLVIEAVSQMAPFLYRPVVGSETTVLGVNKLTGEEMASRLSFFFWSSVPDEELLAAADEGALDSVQGVQAQVERLMNDPRFGRTLESFAWQWLGLEAPPEKDAAEYPGFNLELWVSAKASVAKFFAHVVNDTGGGLSALFTEPVVFADQRLARTYGLSVAGGAFERLPTEPSQRGGIITQAAVLATLAGTTESSPVKRGVFVRSRLLCQTPPPPPPDGVGSLPPPSPNRTQRQRLEEHRANPACAACHAFFDPLGLAFENFDGVGVYREAEHGIAIDASGELTESDVDGTFANAVELMNLIKESQMTAECLTSQFYRFAVGRLESDADACVLKRLTHTMLGEGYALREVFAKLATSDAFRFAGRN